MVRKSGKHGVHSGNTLRASNSKFSRQYRSESCIVRNGVNLNKQQTRDRADDACLDADGVVYSLNKRGRWALPGIIRENIQDQENDIKVAMVERHKLKKQSNCIRYSTNKGKLQSVESRRGLYFDDQSIIDENAEKKPKKKHKRHGTRRTSDETGETDCVEQVPDPEIRYDVFYPSPVTSSITHNPKYIRNCPIAVIENHEIQETTKTSKKGKGKRHRVQINTRETQYELDQFDTFEDEGSEHETDMSTDKNLELEEKCSSRMWSDLFEVAIRAKGLCSSGDEAKRKKKKHRKNKHSDEFQRGVLMPEPDSQEEDEAYSSVDEENSSKPVLNVSGNISSASSPKLIPVRVILPAETVRFEYLRERFGENYMEAECFPRKFILDISNVMMEGIKKSKLFRTTCVATLDMFSCLVFTYSGNYDQGLDVYNVYLNLNASLHTIRLETIFDLMVTTVEEVIDGALSFIYTIPPEYLENRQFLVEMPSTQVPLSFNLVKSVNKWVTDCYHPVHLTSDIRNVPSEIAQRTPSLQNEQAQEVDKSFAETSICGGITQDFETPPLEFCNICFVEIDPTLFESSEATALKSCGHFFCDTCWQEHLRSRIRSGAIKISCPEYECCSEVDICTVVSLISVRDVRLLQQNKVSLIVDSSSNQKWCPNPKCGRVLKSKFKIGSEPSSLMCPCGTSLCFTCLKAAHWPASCDQTTEYKAKLKQFGHETTSPEDCINDVGVRGKSCPGCSRFTEKNGGCKYMYCVCGLAFCWTCCLPWEARNHYACQLESDRAKTKKVMIRHVEKSGELTRSKLYLMAVNNRNERHPRKMRSLKLASNALSLKLKKLVTKNINIGMDKLEKDAYSHCGQKESINSFLSSMVQLKFELNHVVEHTAVYLDGTQFRSGFRKLLHAAERLEVLSRMITARFEPTDSQEFIKQTIPGLCQLRKYAKTGLTVLVGVLSQIQK